MPEVPLPDYYSYNILCNFINKIFFRESGGSKQPVTDEEREQLARRLDEDLDNFIDNLQKTPYKDGWKEETWREVIIINFYSNLYKYLV